MKGMPQLIELRRKGFKPACAYVYDDSSRLFHLSASEWHYSPNRSDGNRLYAHIQLDEVDIPERLDLRPLVGLEVHLLGFRSEARTRRLFEAMKRITPLVIAAPLESGLLIFKKETGDEFFPFP